MESDYQHRILVVEQDEQTKKIISALLQAQKLDAVFADTGEAGLEAIKNNTGTPFSLIISAQGLTGMEGTLFLENTKKKTPDSIRFLMAVYSEMQTIIKAVNKSDVHRFLVKPFDDRDFIKAIRTGLNLYHAFIEHERLLSLAKKQNSKLYELSNQLMKAAKEHTRNLHLLDKEIKRLNSALHELSSHQPDASSLLQEKITAYLTGGHDADAAGKAEILFSQAVRHLYDQFDDLAQKNGLIMPRIEGHS